MSWWFLSHRFECMLSFRIHSRLKSLCLGSNILAVPSSPVVSSSQSAFDLVGQEAPTLEEGAEVD